MASLESDEDIKHRLLESLCQGERAEEATLSINALARLLTSVGVPNTDAQRVIGRFKISVKSFLDYLSCTQDCQPSPERQATVNPGDATDLRTYEPLAEVRKLRKVPFLVMDNSLRESTVAALAGHTPDDKWEILKHVEACGFKHIILGAMSSTAYRVDDLFAQQVRDSPDFEAKYKGVFYAFTEVSDGCTADGIWDAAVPVSLHKMKEYGIFNPIIEVDLGADGVKYESFDQLAMMRDRLRWVVDNLGTPDCKPRICLNMRDFFPTMEKCPGRVEKFVRGMAALEPPLRPWAMNTEDPSGSYLPETLAYFVSKYREWWGPVSSDGPEGGGNMCIHLHKGFGLAEASVLAALGAGMNGVWCGVAEVGAAIGHACSAVTMTNLARYGNPLAGYNVSALRDAAIEITRITTGEAPHPTTEIYGDRANQWVFDFPGMGDDFLGTRWKFNLAGFLMAKKEARVHTLSTNAQFKRRLVETVGDFEWDDEVIMKMRHVMLADLRQNKKFQYQSRLQLCNLYIRAGGVLPETVAEEARQVVEEGSHPLSPAVEGVRKQWCEQCLQGDRDISSIDFRNFYDLFLARMIPCYSCQHAISAWLFFDVGQNGKLYWYEFLTWLWWCELEFPEESATCEGLMDTLFGRIMMPDLRHAFLVKCPDCHLCSGVCECPEYDYLNAIVESPLTQSEVDAKLKGQTVVAEFLAEVMQRGYYPAKKLITDRMSESKSGQAGV